MSHRRSRRTLSTRKRLLLVAVACACRLAEAPAEAGSPRLNQTYRQEVHNAYWFGGFEAFASGPKQHILDSLYIDRARGIELDLHFSDKGGGHHWEVYHTDKPGFSGCVQLKSCLEILRAWHFANPLHDVFFLHLEAKNTNPSDPFFTEAITPFTLDKMLSRSLGDRADPDHSVVFGPADYFIWCQDVRLPQLFPDPSSRPTLD